MKPLKPEYFVYQGSFHIERRSGAGRLGYGGHAMTPGPEGTLYVAGHSHRDMVTQIRPPETFGKRASIVKEAFDIAPGSFRSGRNEFNLDTLGGICYLGGWLYSTWFRFYGVQPNIDDPTMALIREDLRVLGFGGELQHVGPQTAKIPFTQKFTSGYMDLLREGLASLPGNLNLLCGRGDGAGNSTGPRLPSVVVCDPSNPRAALPLIYRSAGNPWPAGWSPDDEWTGMSWITADEYGGLVFVGRKAMSPHWYGKPDMPDKRPPWFEGSFPDDWSLVDRWRGHKGYHVVDRRVECRVYSAEHLEAVVRGDMNPVAVTHSAAWGLEEFHEAARCDACAYDPETRRFYVWEDWPIGRSGTTYPGEDPQIHVYLVDPPLISEPRPEPEVETVEIILKIGQKQYEGVLEEMV